MSITRPDLFDLRGHFVAPQMLEGASLRPGHSITFFEKVFPLSDTLAVLITPTATLLVDVVRREIFWTISCQAQTAALDRVHHLLALGTAGEVTLWNLQTGGLMHRIDLAQDEPVEILFAPDGSWFAVALFEHGVQIWGTADCQLLQTLNDVPMTLQACMKSLAVSPDGSLLAVGADDAALVSLWRVQDGSLCRTLEILSPAQRIYGLAFSSDGHYLVGGDVGGDSAAAATPIWDVHSGRLLIGLGRVSWLPAFRQDGRLIASTAVQEVGTQITDVIYLWDVASRRLLNSFAAHGGRISGLVFSPDGHLLVTWSEDATVRWWDTRTGTEVYRIEGLFSVHASSFFQPDGRLFGAGVDDGRLRLWNLNDGRLLHVLQSSDRLSQGIVASRDGRYLLGWENGGSDVGTLLIWDVRRRREPLRLHASGYERVFAAVISADGSLVLAGCDDKCVRVWSRAREKLLATFWGHHARISSLAFSPDLSWIVAGAQDGMIRLWPMSKGSHRTARRVLSEHRTSISYLAFSADNQYLVSGDEYGVICIWEVKSGLLLQKLDPMAGSIVCLTFDQQIQRLAACDRAQNIWIWKRQPDSQRWQRYEGDQEQEVEIRSQILPLEEKRNQGVLIWQLPSTTGTWQILQDHVQITGVVFHPNGSLMVAGYDHGTTCVWRLDTIIQSQEVLSSEVI